MTNSNFPDPEWRNATVRLLAVINSTFEHPDYLRPKSDLHENDLTLICGALATRSYRPDEWFRPGPAAGMPAIGSDKPPIEPKSEYRLLKLYALQETVSRISLRFGGIVFEDPFYALLACFNVGSHDRLLLIPKVSSVDQAWQHRMVIMNSLAHGAYDPANFFAECAPMDQNRTGLPLTSLTIRGDLLRQLRQVGGGNVPGSTGFLRYALYDFISGQ